MLLGTVVLWALNVTVTKYMVSNGWSPLAYATIRYFLAIVLFAAYTYRREHSFAIERRDVKLVLLAGGLIFGNQLCFVYGLKLTQASTVALLLGAIPMFIGVISAALGLEHLRRSFWIGAVTTSVGVAPGAGVGTRRLERRRCTAGDRHGPELERVHGGDRADDAALLAGGSRALSSLSGGCRWPSPALTRWQPRTSRSDGSCGSGSHMR